MNSKEENIIKDHEFAIEDMTESEIQMALECAIRVQQHLKKAIQQDTKVRYMNNLEIVNSILERYYTALNRGKIAL